MTGQHNGAAARDVARGQVGQRMAGGGVARVERFIQLPQPARRQRQRAERQLAPLPARQQAHRAAERHAVSGQMPRRGIRGQAWRTGHRQQQAQLECGIQVFGQGVGVADPPEIGAQQR